MSFDKIKVMRNAERFLSQGKIRAAISEYKRIVENDPKDFSTLNILGDLHFKNSEKQEAVDCYTLVAEFYHSQGFAQKAIAIYNKIARIEPNSIAVSEKLAQLYQLKGSVAEARVHYTTIAETYQRNGQKLEALSVWKQIAQLDPNNTEIYLKIAEVCNQEDQSDEAAEAYTEAGLRFLGQKKYEAALSAFTKSLEVKKNYLRALNGLVKAQIALGYADEAAKTLENILAEQPFNRDILYLLVDCYIDMNNPAEAERAVVKLVEQEPANYPKFLDLVKIYLKNNDLTSAVRILSVSSEHLLVGGQAEEFLKWTNEILAQNPEQIEALQLLVRYFSWQRDEPELKQSLERLAEAARAAEAIEDERYALSQLIMIAPKESAYAQRLQEINGSGEFEAVVSILAEPEPAAAETLTAVPEFENFTASDAVHDTAQNGQASYGYGEFDITENADSLVYQPEEANSNGASESAKGFDFYEGNILTNDSDKAPEELQVVEPEAEKLNGSSISLGDELKLQKEIESIEFYIAQGYTELAGKTLLALEEEFGKREEIEKLRLQINEPAAQIAVEEEVKPTISAKNVEPVIEQSSEPKISSAKTFETLDELKDQFDAEVVKADEGDFDTHYHTGIAYKEMGLMEDSIREFQDALGLVKADDGTRRFFQCANLIGHCFLEKQMPNLAVVWFNRGLETSDLDNEEKRALYYEIANAYELAGEAKKSIEYFEKLYGEDVDYRNVVERLEALRQSSPAS